MGWTQQDVINELARHSIQITPRRLTDWRQRGLLPALEEIRDAHGRVTYVWNQANIVDQVVEVWALFAQYGHADHLVHWLWLLGYEVRPELVMEDVRAPIVSHWQFWSGGAPADEQLFDDEQKERLLDTIDRLAQRIARRRERRPVGYQTFDDAADQMVRMLSVLNDPTYPPEDIIEHLATRSKFTAPSGERPDQVLVEMVEFAQRHLTPRHLAEIATNATWQEFCEVSEDFSMLREIITIFGLAERLRDASDELDPRVMMIMRNGLLGMFGHWIVMGDIALRRAGYGPRIWGYLSQARDSLRDVDLSAFDEDVTQFSRSRWTGIVVEDDEK